MKTLAEQTKDMVASLKENHDPNMFVSTARNYAFPNPIWGCRKSFP